MFDPIIGSFDPIMMKFDPIISSFDPIHSKIDPIKSANVRMRFYIDQLSLRLSEKRFHIGLITSKTTEFQSASLCSAADYHSL